MKEMFSLRELVRAGDAVELIANLTDNTIPDVLEALYESDILSARCADQVEEYHTDVRDV